MPRTYSHFFRLNPVEIRRQRAPVDAMGVSACLLNVPALLFWVTWALSVIWGTSGPFLAVFAPSTIHRPMLYVLTIAFPLSGLSLALFALNQRRRRSDLAPFAIPISLLLLGAGLVYAIARLSFS